MSKPIQIITNDQLDRILGGNSLGSALGGQTGQVAVTDSLVSGASLGKDLGGTVGVPEAGMMAGTLIRGVGNR